MMTHEQKATGMMMAKSAVNKLWKNITPIVMNAKVLKKYKVALFDLDKAPSCLAKILIKTCDIFRALQKPLP